MTGQDTRIGTQLGKYRLVGRLGEGGMGVVYAAEDSVLARRVALKILSRDAGQAPGAEQRFFLEARAAARLNHPNVVTVHDVGRQGDLLYLVMELVDGTSAQTVLDQCGPLPWPRATRIIADVCRGLTAAHAAGLYALGGTYHALLTGRPPYDSPDTVQVLFAHCAADVPDPRHRVPELPEACAAIVMKALAKKRADRFRTSAEMLAALTAVLATVPANPAPPALAVPTPVAMPAEHSAADQPIVLISQPLTAPLRRRRFGPILAALVVVAVLVLGLVTAIPFLLPGRPEESQSDESRPQPPIPQGERITLGPCLPLGTHQGPARDLAFGGRRFASVGADKIARVWDLDRLKAPPGIFKHSEELTCVALWMPPARRVAGWHCGASRTSPGPSRVSPSRPTGSTWAPPPSSPALTSWTAPLLTGGLSSRSGTRRCFSQG
jgi:hypothetical protein